MAPVFEFGSAFRDPNMYPNMIPMAMPEYHHLHCYQEWVVRGTVCKWLKAAEKGGNGELVFGDEKDLEWKDLIVSQDLHHIHDCWHIFTDLLDPYLTQLTKCMSSVIFQPQLIWRGSDFGYLSSLTHP